jgi:hypothetical protein
MKDILQDIVSHTMPLVSIGVTTLKINSDNTETSIESIADDRSVILKATTHDTVEDFDGTFGMPDITKLSYHLKNPEYAQNAVISVVKGERNGNIVPTHVHFENAAGDFHNDYRFMDKSVIEEKLKSVKSKITSWDVEVEPSIAAINRLKLMAGTLDQDDKLFQVKTEDGNLNFYFGDLSTHAGSFTFHHGVDGKLRHTWAWPVEAVQKILGLDGDKKLSITDQGAMKISIDSGLATYEYILPAQQK